MSLKYALGRARASATGNPITFSYTVAKGDRGLALLLKVDGATNRAGGAPTYGSQTFTQANTTQKAAASPEASCELWLLANPTVGTATLTIPNTGALNIFHTVGIARDPNDKRVLLGPTNGANNTAANPSPGAITTDEDG